MSMDERWMNRITKTPPETRYARGQAKGGVVWWEDGRAYVDLLKGDGEVLMMALGRSEKQRRPGLARTLFLAFAADRLGIGLDEAEARYGEHPTDPFWDDLASVLVQLRTRGG